MDNPWLPPGPWCWDTAERAQKDLGFVPVQQDHRDEHSQVVFQQEVL